MNSSLSRKGYLGELRAILSEDEIHFFTKSERLFSEGDLVEGIFCLNSGKVKLTKKDEKGNSYIITLAKEGDILGVHNILSDEFFTTTAEALEPTSAFFIPQEAFISFLKERPEVYMAVMKGLCEEIKFVESRISSFVHKTARQRLADILVMLYESFGDDKGAVIDLHLSENDLACLINTSASKLQQLVEELDREGVIESVDDLIYVKNFDRMYQIAKFNESR